MDAPRDDLFRAIRPGPELRADDERPQALPTLFGHFAVFNRWTEIESFLEGHFLERIAPGAFAKTIQEQRDRMRVLFNHGRDPQIGDKVLGAIDDVREDEVGAYYEVPLFQTSYNRDLLPGLEASQYGASFRFRVIKEEWNDEPGVSDHNPKGLPERTILEMAVPEFGPVTFPAYDGATAGVRSITDRFRTPEAAHEGTSREGAANTSTDEPPEGTRRTPTPAQLLRRIHTRRVRREP